MDYSESKILRFSAGEVYDPARVEFDKELLRRFYYSKGYPNFEVLSAVGEIDRNNRWFDITFLINEGDFVMIIIFSINNIFI